MKFKTQKEVKEEVQDDKTDINGKYLTTIHEYLDFFDYVQQQFMVLSTNKQSKLNIVTMNYARENLEKYFSWIPNGNYTLITKGKSIDYVNVAYDVVIKWIDKFNDLISKLVPYDAYVISQFTALSPRMVGNIKQAYKDFQENPEEAKEKWFKCE